ncbi:hypothetical protein [Janthinobacterium fluminis]|uniref:Uncharacterized protein n=1 Tax=Janthinobacterium fluminis TaxID=2987524 RepID=A0ABT5K143_9BURK|nr:hypothetical protein [Janthinobacterium fluminis]MDC8758128.1 hypothetical protein [Janthinobacterium fluminis]
MLSVGKRFNVSSSYLARVCTHLNVPRPARGYWAKLAVGKAPPRPNLPEVQPGEEISWEPNGGIPDVSHAPSNMAKKSDTPRKGKATTRHTATEHALLANTRALFLVGRLTHRGDYLKPAKRLLPDLQVTKTTLDVALEFANQFFLALERRGHRVTFASVGEQITRPPVDTRDKPDKTHSYNNFWSPARNTVLYLNGTPIGITILELTESTKMRYVNGKYVHEVDYVAPKSTRGLVDHWTSTQDIPSGRLCLQLYASYYDTKWSRQWKETRSGDFVKKLTSLVREVEDCQEDAASTIKLGKEHAEAEKFRYEAMRRKWKEDEEEKRRLNALKESYTELDALIEASEKRDRLERFIAKIEREVADLDEHDMKRLQELINEARQLLGNDSTIENFMNWRFPRERI